MIIIFIRNFTIAFWLLFIFVKSLNLKPTMKIVSAQLVYSVAISLLIVTINSLIPEMIAIVTVVSACVFNKIVSKLKWNTVIATTVIACGISYALSAMSIVLSSIIFGFAFGADGANNKSLSLLLICVFFIMWICVLGLFRIKRFKSGFPFLHDKNINLIGALIALIISFYYTVVNIIANRTTLLDVASLLPLFSIVVCAILIIIWWRTGITKTYRDYLNSQEVEELNATIAAKDARIAEVEKSNAYLSRQIHSDNKLIPALQNAVRTLSAEYSEELANDILDELDRVSAERKLALQQYKKATQKLPLTQITSLDITLDYMKQKACDSGIEFDVIISGNIKDMIKNHISEELLRTMTADLLENAIIATKSCETRRILLTIGICDDCYVVQVEDSGVAFEAETLQELGKKRTTTHADEGGSGIGMMEVFEIMRDTGASLYIEKLCDSRGFTKRVSVRFDGKGEYIHREVSQVCCG